jgi:nucleotide-binding universal stress UspA family protein
VDLRKLSLITYKYFKKPLAFFTNLFQAVFRRHFIMQIKKILVTTDFSEVSKKALAHAVYLKNTFGAELDIAYVVFDEKSLPTSYVSQETMKEFANKLETGVQKHMNNFIADCDMLKDIEFNTVVLRGTPYAQIVDYAKKAKTDLIVIGTNGRTGIKHMLLGSTAEKVIARAPCAVYCIRPS